ncbi:hypothetical protein L207DRAFT_238620 [Hyaloscypha variabilis F]|uniref:F-box domain-containing protein n=1 Tax=Hyaloscypha variabilis (strain UAMH 11265 / GT02V1 / F) TaxID=1149755 RepID=A0A2J6QT51_HYAVF|nr:hypothetical protein L207DRAFT_238620 [Hyaloscypha variabilis F]
MASTTNQTTMPANRAMPDFTFPPKFTSSETSASFEQARIPKSPPHFGFPYFPPPPNPSPISMPDIISPITPLPSSAQLPSSPKPISPFLTIPLEIRLQIYTYVLHSHPIHHAHLAPIDPPTTFAGMNTEEFHTTRLAPTLNSSRSSLTEIRTLITHLAPSPSTAQEISAIYPVSKPTSLTSSPSRQTRVQGKIPTALLLSCKQVFEECKMVPWEQNTFTFINWFWSGVYASRQFTRSLRPWQSDGVRYVGVEVLGRDLRVDGMKRIGGGIGGASVRGKELGEWWELCGLWRGVWGLRLGIKGGVGEEKSEVDGSAGWNGELGSKVEDKEKGVLDVTSEWVTDGLLKMKNLRWVEIEIEDEDVSEEEKIAFCGELEAAFNTETSQEDKDKEDERINVNIIFISRLPAPEEPVSNKDFTWYGGTAGDDSVWGLDM